MKRTYLRMILPALLVVLLAACTAPLDPTEAPVSAPAQTEAAQEAYPLPTQPAPAAPVEHSEAYPTLPQAAGSPYPGPAGPGGAADELPADAVLRLTRTGGIAGIVETWTVFADGRVESASGAGSTAQPAGQLDSGQIETLIASLDSLGFFNLDAQYGDPNACCDMIRVTLQVRSGERVQTVAFNEGEDAAPAPLLAAVEAVQKVLEGIK